MPHRGEFGGGVVLGDDHHQRGQHQADQRSRTVQQVMIRSAADVEVAFSRYRPASMSVMRVEGDQRQHAGDDQAAVQRVHDLAAFGAP